MSFQLSAAALTDFICPYEMAEKQGNFFSSELFSSIGNKQQQSDEQKNR
jgi:hypothetical protein